MVSLLPLYPSLHQSWYHLEEGDLVLSLAAAESPIRLSAGGNDSCTRAVIDTGVILQISIGGRQFCLLRLNRPRSPYRYTNRWRMTILFLPLRLNFDKSSARQINRNNLSGGGDDVVPSSIPQTPSIMVPLYKSPESALEEDDDHIPSTKLELSSTTLAPTTSASTAGGDLMDCRRQSWVPPKFHLQRGYRYRKMKHALNSGNAFLDPLRDLRHRFVLMGHARRRLRLL